MTRKLNHKNAFNFKNVQIFQHFAHSEQFKVYMVEGGKIMSSKVIANRQDNAQFPLSIVHCINEWVITQ